MDDTPTTALQLTAVQARIVASLFEKEATTADAYPLTANAIVLACNQKTAREPVMELEPGEVGHALRQLESLGWVKSQHAARAERYAHRIEAVLSLTRTQAALLSLLILRGPQTAHELLARSERLARLESVDDVQHALERLAQRTPALVVALPRQSGQREGRYAHLLSGEPVQPTPGAVPSRAEAAGSLAERVAALESRVAKLEALLSRSEDGAPDARRQ